MTKNPTYIWTFVIIFMVTVSAILSLVLFQPDRDHTQEIVYIIGLMAPTTAAMLAYLKTQENHELVNSRMTEFKDTLEELSVSKIATSKAEGINIGKDKANKRTDELKNNI